MNRERLTMLADYLNGVKEFKGRAPPSNKFDLELWQAPYKHFKKEFDLKGTPKKKPFKLKTIKIGEEKYRMSQPNECQTAGCAIGWAATIPEFIAQGFFLAENSSRTKSNPFPCYVPPNKCHSILFEFDAIVGFFAITQEESSKLFLERYYKPNQRRQPSIVANRIKSFLKTKTNDDRLKWRQKYDKQNIT